MKRKTLSRERQCSNRRSGALRLALLLALVITTIFAPISATVSVAMAITGTQHGSSLAGQGDTTHYVPSVSDVITRIEPSSFPFTTFMDRLKRRLPTKRVIHQWGEVSSYPREDMVNGVTTAGAANGAKTITVDSLVKWNVGDIFYAPNNATSEGPYLITGVSGNDLTVYALKAATDTNPYNTENFGTVPAFADDEKIFWISNAKTEKDKASDSRVMQPAYKYNFVHTFDALVDVSDHKMREENFGTQDWIRQRQENLKEYRKSKEYAAIFNGAPAKHTEPTKNKVLWTAGGARHFINTTLDLALTSGAPTEAQIVDFVYGAFDDDGSMTKVLMGGTDFLKAVDKVNTGQALNVTRKLKYAGVEITQLRVRKGTLLTVFHPGFDEMGIPDEAVVLDMDKIIERVYQAEEKRAANFKESGDLIDAEGEYYIGKCTWEYRDSGTHKWCALA